MSKIMSKILVSFAAVLLLVGLAAPAYAETAPGEAVGDSDAGRETAQLLTRLSEAVDEVGAWVRTTEQFAPEQVPLLVKEILYWEIALRGFMVSLSLSMLGYALWGCRWSYRQGVRHLKMAVDHTAVLKEGARKQGRSSYDTRDIIFSLAHYGVPISSGILGIVGGIMFLISALKLIKPISAPRLFLIEFLRAFPQ